MGPFNLEKAPEDLINEYKHLKGGCREDRARFFPVAGQEVAGTNWNTSGSSRASGNTLLL